MIAGGLTPTTPSPDETARTKSVPSGFESGWLNRVGQTVYKRVGEWRSEQIKRVIRIQQPVNFIIWLSSTGASSGDFKFTLRYGAAVISGPTETRVSNIQEKAQRVMVEASANLTTTEGGKELFLLVEAKVNGDGMVVKYGGFQEDSGVSFLCDAIKFEDIWADDDGLSVEFRDSFHTSLNDLYPVLHIDDHKMSEDLMKFVDRRKSIRGNVLFIWDTADIEKEVSLKPGVHRVQVGIAYASMDINHSWSYEKNVEVKAEEQSGIFEDMEFGEIMTAVALILTIMIYVVVTFTVTTDRSRKSVFERSSPVPDRYKVIWNKKAKLAKMAREKKRRKGGRPQIGGEGEGADRGKVKRSGRSGGTYRKIRKSRKFGIKGKRAETPAK